MKNNNTSKRKHSQLKVGLVMIMAVLLLLPVVHAFGISSPYHKTNPLVLSPGESRDVIVTLQNMVGGRDLLVKAEIIGGNEIASIVDAKPEYLVPFGSANTEVKLRIAI